MKTKHDESNHGVVSFSIPAFAARPHSFQRFEAGYDVEQLLVDAALAQTVKNTEVRWLPARSVILRGSFHGLLPGGFQIGC